MEVSEYNAVCGELVDIGRGNHSAALGTRSYVAISHVVVQNENDIGGASSRDLVLSNLRQVVPLVFKPDLIVNLSTREQTIADHQHEDYQQ